jgi:STE24 endopeptidase
MGDQVKNLLVNLTLSGILAILLFGIVRRLQRTWWVWGSAVTLGFMIVVVLIGPIYIVPIFNKVRVLNDPKVTQPILSLARANGIPANDV